MGPNGSGKSTLAQVLAGRTDYEVTDGQVLFQGKDLLEMDPEERAREGVFLAFQYPVEIPGVSQHLLPEGGAQRHAQAPRPAGARRPRVPEARAREDEAGADGRVAAQPPGQRGLLGRREEAQRDLPHGGARAAPRDARRDRLGARHRRPAHRRRRRQRAARPRTARFLVITHYQRLLNYIVPDLVHVLVDGRIVRSGGKELALRAGGEGLRLARGQAPAAPPKQPPERVPATTVGA